MFFAIPSFGCTVNVDVERSDVLPAEFDPVMTRRACLYQILDRSRAQTRLTMPFSTDWFPLAVPLQIGIAVRIP